MNSFILYTKKLILILPILAVPSLSATAGVIRFDFSGFVLSSEIIEGANQGQQLTNSPAIGSPIFGYYTFQSPSLDTAFWSDAYGDYDNVLSLMLNIGSISYSYSVSSPTPYAEIRIENDVASVHRDRYTVIVRDTTGNDFTGPKLGEFSPRYFQLDVFDFEGGQDPDLLPDNSLPVNSPDLSLVTDALGLGPDTLTSLLLQYNDGTARAKIRGQLTSLSTHPVPEPNAFMLFMLWLLFIIFNPKYYQHKIGTIITSWSH